MSVPGSNSVARAFYAESGLSGAVAAVVLLLLIISFAYSAMPLAASAISHGAGAGPGVSAEDTSKKLSHAMSSRVDQIVGRSLFFEPAPPKVEEAPTPTADDGPPPPPSRYGGPALIAMINNTAFFSDGKRLHPDTVSESGDLTVLSLNAPWSAHVRWHGAEFDVPLFSRDSVVFPTGVADTPPASERTEPAAPATDEPEKPTPDPAAPTPANEPTSPTPTAPPPAPELSAPQPEKP